MSGLMASFDVSSLIYCLISIFGQIMCIIYPTISSNVSVAIEHLLFLCLGNLSQVLNIKPDPKQW